MDYNNKDDEEEQKKVEALAKIKKDAQKITEEQMQSDSTKKKENPVDRSKKKLFVAKLGAQNYLKCWFPNNMISLKN